MCFIVFFQNVPRDLAIIFHTKWFEATSKFFLAKLYQHLGKYDKKEEN